MCAGQTDCRSGNKADWVLKEVSVHRNCGAVSVWEYSKEV